MVVRSANPEQTDVNQNQNRPDADTISGHRRCRLQRTPGASSRSLPRYRTHERDVQRHPRQRPRRQSRLLRHRLAALSLGSDFRSLWQLQWQGPHLHAAAKNFAWCAGIAVAAIARIDLSASVAVAQADLGTEARRAPPTRSGSSGTRTAAVAAAVPPAWSEDRRAFWRLSAYAAAAGPAFSVPPFSDPRSSSGPKVFSGRKP